MAFVASVKRRGCACVLGWPANHKDYKLMRIAYLMVSAALLLALGACTKPDNSAPAASTTPAPAASESKDSTSLNINTDSGSVSYDKQDGGDKTSISIGDSEEKK